MDKELYLKYWGNEVSYQVEFLEETSFEQYQEILMRYKETIKESVAKKIIDDDQLWEVINLRIDELIKETAEEIKAQIKQ